MTSVALAAVLAAACAGPKAPIEVGVKEFPVNILLGGTDKPAAPKVIPADPFVELPILPSVVKVTKPVETPRGPCPEFHPFAGPKVVATNRARNLPVEGTYAWRHSGNDGYPPMTSRKVTNIAGGQVFGVDPSFSFDVVEDVGGLPYTTHYMSIPDSAADAAPAGPRASGLYLTGTEQKRSDGSTRTFAPQSPLLLVQYPAEPGTKWVSAATDPLTATVVEYDAGIVDGAEGIQVDKLKVNACGEPLDAWAVKARIRTISGVTSDVTQETLVGYALQYGGFPIFEQVKTYQTSNAASGKDRTSTINKVPNKPPGAF